MGRAASPGPRSCPIASRDARLKQGAHYTNSRSGTSAYASNKLQFAVGGEAAPRTTDVRVCRGKSAPSSPHPVDVDHPRFGTLVIRQARCRQWRGGARGSTTPVQWALPNGRALGNLWMAMRGVVTPRYGKRGSPGLRAVRRRDGRVALLCDSTGVRLPPRGGRKSSRTRGNCVVIDRTFVLIW
jgi:hypothetical protein